MLPTLHPKERAFFVLTEKKTGNYIQLAGARKRLTVEARIKNKKSFQHYRFGRAQKDAEKTYINCKVGPINVIKSQALTLQEATIIFKVFFTSGSLCNEFKLEDISET